MITLPALDETHASWRDIYQVHPCADVFPMMSDEEIDELAKDISANGLREADRPLACQRGSPRPDLHPRRPQSPHRVGAPGRDVHADQARRHVP